MAVPRPLPDDVSEAEANIPADWLMPTLDLEMVRQTQRPDSQAFLTPQGLSLVGVELRIERRWIRERFWKQIKESVARGYVFRSSPIEIVLRADRRSSHRSTRASGR